MSTASSLNTLEYWIAMLCGLLGAFLAALWLMFLFAAALWAFGIKTRNTVLTYWSALFTPKFLRRLLISLLGVQLAVSSQAVAAPLAESTAETPTTNDVADVFMPDVVTSPDHHSENGSSLVSPQPETTHQSDDLPEVLDDNSPVATPDGSTLKPQPRQTSEIIVSPSTDRDNSMLSEIEPLPRQTSTVPSSPKPAASPSTKSSKQSYVPQRPVVSPFLGAMPKAPDSSAATIVVQDGDCLWDIAHAELGAEATLYQIDERWRAWWEHNRNVLGDEPHTLLPGTVLTAPPFVN